MDYSEIRDLIIKEIQTDKQLLTSFLAINRMIEDKTATYTALAEFSKVLGDRVGQNIIKNILEDIPEGELTEFAEKCLAPIYKDMETTMLMLCNNVQFMQNAKAKIGLAPVNVQLDESRINNAVRRFAEAVDFASVKFLANSNTAKSIARNVVNESIKQNSEFQEKAGLNVLLSRSDNGGCCKWCKTVTGTFTSFEDLPVGFWAIHNGCGCTIDYKVGKTKSRLKFSTNENGKLEKYVEDIPTKEALVKFEPISPEKAIPTALMEFKQWASNLTDVQRKLINRYSYNPNDSIPRFYERINSFIRNGYNGEKDYSKQVEEISKALKNAKLQNDYICYRGSDYNPFEELKENEIGTANQFFSSSLKKSAAFKGKYKFVILAPKGTHAAYIQDVASEKFKKQREMLFDKDVEFELLSKKGNVITLRAIP